MAKSKKTKFELHVINKVRDRRIELHLSQDDLAFYLNVSRSFIGQVESPNYPTKYNLNHLNILAKELRCSPKDFLPEESL